MIWVNPKQCSPIFPVSFENGKFYWECDEPLDSGVSHFMASVLEKCGMDTSCLPPGPGNARPGNVLQQPKSRVPNSDGLRGIVNKDILKFTQGPVWNSDGFSCWNGSEWFLTGFWKLGNWPKPVLNPQPKKCVNNRRAYQTVCWSSTTVWEDISWYIGCVPVAYSCPSPTISTIIWGHDIAVVAKNRSAWVFRVQSMFFCAPSNIWVFHLQPVSKMMGLLDGVPKR